ncbi:hypothetical protein HOLleu_12905 [Holothuria leucospilota]|uniref:Uncharacterized protein n=1 Tax=Holothuria leucospilota TaxID=206669 RepID=A0A9Q1CCB8_HOLLE|nr:hypothetical protein HOLleu_12905 [Holothuria leucospilota]
MAPVVGQEWSAAYDKDNLQTCSNDNSRRERQRRPILASHGEVVFTSVDMKTYRTKPKTEANATTKSAKRTERANTPVYGSKNDAKSSSQTPEKGAELSRDLHGTKRLRALLLQEASQSIPLSNDNKKGTKGERHPHKTKIDKQPTSSVASPLSPRQHHDQYAFVKNVKPSMVKLALQYAKPINENVKEATHRKNTDTPDGDVHSLPKRMEEVNDLTDKSATEKIPDVRRFVRTLRNEREHVGLLWIAPPLIIGTAVFLVLVLAMCASLFTAAILSSIPLLEKIADEALRRLYRCGYMYETEDESTCRDFLEKLICQVETRTKAKIVAQLKQGISPRDL